ncbi:ISAs1 family transposase [Enterobacter bugandensis]|uniref:ISAs1 family transposase n=1 Tax=Enterobacter bugandensis TaxID=881260 RepID=UPI00283A9B95|nr:ISAs1 family transposase [Enterobacter bugandensis]WMU73266.1 ISAs1 family transposase [Enterobacter bugandensis]
MNIFSHLVSIPDPRSDINVKHNLLDVLFLVLSAVLSGARGWKDIQVFGDAQLEWLQKHRAFENGIPRRHCIANIIRILNTDLLVQALLGWVNERRQSSGKPVIAIDGKTMRRAWGDDIHKALHVVSAYDVENGLTLYQQASDSKGKEREIARNIIDMLALKGCVVTLDALHCQKETLNRIVLQQGDFIVQLKANQEKLYQHVQKAFSVQYDNPELAEYVEKSTGHGRHEVRRVMQIKADLPAELKKSWPHINSLIEIGSERTVNGQTSCDARWYLSSLPVAPQEAARIVRRHWAIENELHWVLDVAFREDEVNISDATGAAHIALVNRVALALLRKNTFKDSIVSKRNRAGWNADFRTELLFG